VHGTTSRPAGCESNFAVGLDGSNSSLADLQAQYAAWRPYYTAKLRKAMGQAKVLIANAPAPSVRRPGAERYHNRIRALCGRPGQKRHFLRCHLSIKGIILPRQARDKHRESTQKRLLFFLQNPHARRQVSAASRDRALDSGSLNEVCRQTLLGQKAQTDLAGLEPVFGLWLTHSEVMLIRHLSHFPLCLSRACLGKMILFSIKGLKKGVLVCTR
jgi:hypothetical protein